MTIEWETRKHPDGRLAKTSRIVLKGVGPMGGGRALATVQVAIAESRPDGPTQIIAQHQIGSGGKPLVWKEEAACLETAELVVEDEMLPKIAAEIAKWCCEARGYNESDQQYTGFDSYRR